MEEFKKYVLSYFDQCDFSTENPGIGSTYHLRFELGGGLENGTEERVVQSAGRATRIFEEFFEQGDEIWVFICSCTYREVSELFTPTKGYLEDQFQNYEAIVKSTAEVTIEEFGDALNENTGDTELTDFTTTHVQTVFKVKVEAINYNNVLRGIANLEMGFDPSVGGRVYFVNTRNNIAFHMYDDRGCLLFSHDKETLQPAYSKYNAWLVDYWRSVFDGLFKPI